jgi:hypothetical protein
MATQTAPTTAPARYMQGIAVPAESVDQMQFMARTRRHTGMEKQFSYTGQPTETVELRKSDILSGITIKFSGQVVVAIGTGTVGTTSRWPLDLLKAVRLSANGVSNLINCSGAKLKVRDIMKKSDLTDRGVTQTIAGVSRTQGTLAQAAESWGVGSNTAALTNGTYQVELEWFVPVAEDEIDLSGAVFLATSSSDVSLALDLESPANLFLLTGNGAATLTGNFQVHTTKFSIPIGNDGQIVVPDLSCGRSGHPSARTRVGTTGRTGASRPSSRSYRSSAAGRRASGPKGHGSRPTRPAGADGRSADPPSSPACRLLAGPGPTRRSHQSRSRSGFASHIG